jgi:hypothetical protein
MTIQPVTRALLQVIFGMTLGIAMAAVLLYSGLPIFWEHEDEQPHVYSITWHSGVLLILLVLLTQCISYMVFRWIGGRRKRGSNAGSQ